MQQATGRGKMLQVAWTREQAEQRLAGRADVVIGAVNSVTSLVLSGDAQAVLALHDALGKEGVAVQMLPVNYAFPQPADEPLCNTAWRAGAQP